MRLRWKGWERFCGFHEPQKKTNEWVLNKAGVTRKLLDTVKARKLAYYGHTIRKQRSRLEKEIMQGTMPGKRRRGRPRTTWMDNINTWTGLPVEESVWMTEDRDKWRKYVHGVANPRIEDCERTEHNSPFCQCSSNDKTPCVCVCVCSFVFACCLPVDVLWS